MARSVAGSEAGFFARHWLGLLGAVVAANALAVGAILFEPGPARAQPAAVDESPADEPAAAALGGRVPAVDAPPEPVDAPPEPADAPPDKAVDLKLPGYLPPLKGMPQVAALPVGPDGLPMSPEVAEGFAMIEEFRGTLERLLGVFDRSGRTTAAAEAFKAAFAAEASRMAQRAAKLDLSKLPEPDQTRLRNHGEKVLMPVIKRMQAMILGSVDGQGAQQGEHDPVRTGDEADLDEPYDLVEEPEREERLDPADETHLEPVPDVQAPDPLTRVILE
ncbi:MAG: hypothetical protein FJ100_04300 [Deltaproteobacteria bacterium]|nr:hypothetical protein [Deltaproteobacteria bacterium]